MASAAWITCGIAQSFRIVARSFPGDQVRRSVRAVNTVRQWCFRCTAMASLTACARLPDVQANDNRVAAGERRGDTLVVALVVQRARWHPEAPDGPFVDVEALGEEGKAPSVPAPLLRVPTGTVIAATVRNALPDSTVWVHGLYTRPAAAQDSIAVPPGESRTLTFAAGAPGTYAWGAIAGTVDYAVREREQIIGALVIDSTDTAPDDRIFVMNIWGEPVDSTAYRNAVAINGKSFPFNETVRSTIGDTVRWRWVNATIRPHPMHMHGFYFSVDARGAGLLADTVLSEAERRLVVTEEMSAMSTMAVSWVPDRDGRWLFHCHIMSHSVAQFARLEAPHDDHAMMSGDPGEHMAGLVLGIDVSAPAGWTPPARESPRALRLFVREGPKLGRSPRAMGYAIEHGSDSPTEPLTRVGGPPLVLTRGQPTDITVINQLNEHTSVHWHGLELESFSDGVAGWSGTAGNLAPRIAPSDSFTARLSMPRAGTFIYHTHLNDEVQLTSGLYGAIIVKDAREAFDPSFDHVYVVGWDGVAPRPSFLVNGDSVLPPMTWRPGRTHRFRIINIGPVGEVRTLLQRDSTPVAWVPVAKDGADLPPQQATSRPARHIMEVGQTADFEFTPQARGEYVLSIRLSGSAAPVTQKIRVR